MLKIFITKTIDDKPITENRLNEIYEQISNIIDNVTMATEYAEGK